ncbi:bifunctional 3,4-dihydroxy-2-butanone-4-phosphate synthase/GTP cyclohydrolase II [Synechococcus sp. PCC 7336]|uniref:bifunctional 3,4-dihydroxy-2-butanone-4-phosphate synthase/GTP cyclohydrolase II n=1 Tax=Synechococcus sp. PCC 7336 TaxID=195250 RepID=UPI00034CCCEE|nr:bifunctional 3,4-dihydroxy-2-butanone-4-phosphate synthase/GTP cyclohydrolase II [Synechococcus sp. PCC 7336]
MPITNLSDFRFHKVEEALEDLKAGRSIIVVDDENRENEGDLVCAAQFATPDAINFMAVHARGLICLAMEGDRLDRLKIPMMVEENTDSNQTAFTVSIDAAPHLGVSTGISASDRSRTIQAAIQPQTKPEDLRRPGHIFPLRVREGGVLVRAGHTEASIDLARLAGLYPAGVICEIQNPDGSMARLPELIEFSRERNLKIITIADLIAYRLCHERFVRRESVAQMPTEFGQFQIYAYRDTLNGGEHVAIVKGNPADFPQSDVLVRVHSECLTGDALGSVRCDCRRQLQTALKTIEHHGQGVVVYLRQEGRGIGLINKLKAYSLQDMGLDTVEANERLGFAADLRNYGVGAQILNDLGVRNMRLITNNPRKIAGLKGFGLEVVDRVPLIVEANDFSARYLATKAEKLGHLLLRTRLLSVALYPQSEEQQWSSRERAEWVDHLNHLTESSPLLVQADPRPIASAMFSGASLVAHVGLAEALPAAQWYVASSDPQLVDYRKALIQLLVQLSQHPQLRAIAWMVSAGRDPLANLQEDWPEQHYDCDRLSALEMEEAIDWRERTVYRLKTRSATATSPVSA